MSAPANIVAFDGAAIPVSHTFNPIGNDTDPVTKEVRSYWRESLLTVPEDGQLRVTATKRKLKNGKLRVAINVEVPLMETAVSANAAGYTAPPKVADVDSGQIVFYFGPRSTIASKRLVRQLLLNIGGNISTSVATLTTGMAPELFDQSIVAS